MATFTDARLDRDANFREITSNEAIRAVAPWTFIAATTGATGVHSLFTVTGDIILSVFATVETIPADAGAPTIEVGVVGNTAVLIAQGLAKSLSAGEVWVDGTLTRVGAGAIPASQIITGVTSIDLKVATATVTSGKLNFYALWRPLSATGSLTVTTPA